MRSFSWFLASLLLTAPLCTASAADANGYTAQYECRAGGPKCNVDVAALVSRACDQTILPSDRDWSKITNNRSAEVFCIQAGDHTSKGPLTINFSGSAGNYKVLRYYRSNDINDEPWHQSATNQAKIDRVKFSGANYWIVHRLAFDPNYALGSFAIHLDGVSNGASHIIINRVLAQRGAKQVWVQGATDSTVQNSVFRDSLKRVNVDADGVGLGWTPHRVSIVNNEIYRIHSHGIYTTGNSDCSNCVIENNDVYVDSSVQYTNCRGSYTIDPNAPCADAEAGISLKSGGGSSSGFLRVMHNRIWGHRRTDTNVCCISGGQGNGMTLSSQDVSDTGARYVLLLNNIVTHTQDGVVTAREGPRNNSIVGNVFYHIKDYYAAVGNIGSWALSSLGHWDYNEVYLNTVIDSSSWANIGGGNSSLDVQCNAIIASGPRTGGTPDGSTIVNYNAFIGTPRFTTDSDTDTNVTRITTTRSSSTSYGAGSLVQFVPVGACRTGRESACFLYQAITGGITEANVPNACTDLGCEFNDGGVTWKAVRGPYFYKRKLRTVPGGETAFIPYARVHTSAPESRSCDAPLGGSKGGSGVDDSPVL